MTTLDSEEFLDYAKIVMGTLGHRVFEPLLQQKPVDASVDAEIVMPEHQFEMRPV